MSRVVVRFSKKPEFNALGTMIDEARRYTRSNFTFDLKDTGDWDLKDNQMRLYAEAEMGAELVIKVTGMDAEDTAWSFQQFVSGMMEKGDI